MPKKDIKQILLELERAISLLTDSVSNILLGKPEYYDVISTQLRSLICVGGRNLNPLLINLSKKLDVPLRCYGPNDIDPSLQIYRDMTMCWVGSIITLDAIPVIEQRRYNLEDWVKARLFSFGDNYFTPNDVIRLYAEKFGIGHYDDDISDKAKILFNIQYPSDQPFKNEIEKVLLQTAYAVIVFGNTVIKKGKEKLNDKQTVQYLEEIIGKLGKEERIQCEAKLAFLKGDLKTAKELCEKILQDNPNDLAIHINMACMYAGYFKSPDKAKKHLDEVIRIQPNNDYAHYALGVIYSQGFSDYTTAKCEYKKCIELNPKYSPAYTNLGILRFTQFKDYDKAKLCFETAIQLEPNNSKNWYNLGCLLHHALKDAEKARQMYIRSIELNPYSANAHNDLGWLYEREFNNFVDAKKHYILAIENDPNHIIAKNNLYFLLENMKSVR